MSPHAGASRRWKRARRYRSPVSSEFSEASGIFKPQRDTKIGICPIFKPLSDTKIGICPIFKPQSDTKVGTCPIFKPLSDTKIGTCPIFKPQSTLEIGASPILLTLGKADFGSYHGFGARILPYPSQIWA